MKRELLLLAIIGLMSAMTAMANHAHSILKVRMHNNQPIVVVVDGFRYGPADIVQRIEGLPGGYHHVKVVTVNRNPYSGQAQRRVVFNGNVHVTPGMEIRSTVDHRGRFRVVEQYAINYGPNVPTPGYGPAPVVPGTCGVVDVPGNRPPRGNGYGHGMGGYGHGGHYGHTTGYTQQPVGSIPMHASDFNALLHTIDTKAFDSTREQIAISALNSNYFTAEQVRQLLQVFTFESTRLRVAKAAYGSVLDPDRFYLVYDAFTFESSVSELNAFIYNS